eukprot:269866-Lingulodinium_polyedra.AAC.1
MGGTPALLFLRAPAVAGPAGLARIPDCVLAAHSLDWWHQPNWRRRRKIVGGHHQVCPVACAGDCNAY